MGDQTETVQMSTWEGLLRTVGWLLKTFEKELQEAEGLPLPWFDVLIQLSSAAGGRLRMQALADSVVLSRSGLTRLIDRMEKADLVRRESAEGDRRGYFAVLTVEGKRVFAKAHAIHERQIEKYFDRHLSESDRKALSRTITKVRQGNGLSDPGRVTGV